MKKAVVVLLVFCVFVVPSSAFCQSNGGMSGGFVSTIGDLYCAGSGYGVTLSGQWFTTFKGNEAFSYGGTVSVARAHSDVSRRGSITTHYGNSMSWDYDLESDATFTELIPSVRYRFASIWGLSFYAQAGLGVSHISIDYDFDEHHTSHDYTWSATDSHTEFGYSLGVGGIYSTYEAMIQYKSFGEAEYFALTVGYIF